MLRRPHWLYLSEPSATGREDEEQREPRKESAVMAAAWARVSRIVFLGGGSFEDGDGVGGEEEGNGRRVMPMALSSPPVRRRVVLSGRVWVVAVRMALWWIG